MMMYMHECVCVHGVVHVVRTWMCFTHSFKYQFFFGTCTSILSKKPKLQGFLTHLALLKVALTTAHD